MNNKSTAIIRIKNGSIQNVSMDSGIIIIVEDHDCPDEENDRKYTRFIYQK